MKLSTKLIITVGTGVIGLFVVAAVGLQQISRIHKTTVDFSGIYFPAQGVLDDASLALQQLKGIVLETIVDGREKTSLDKLEREFTDKRSELLSLLKQYREHMVYDDTDRKLFLSESPRVLRRLQHLRRWSHEKVNEVFPRST